MTVASTGKTKVEYLNAVEHLIIERKKAHSMRTAFAKRSWDIVFDQICFNADEARIACQTFAGKIGQLIFTSSQSVYDYGIDIEESTFDPLTYLGKPNNQNWYQEGKRLAEQVYAQQSEFPVKAVRFPVVLGSDDHTRRLHWHIARIKFGHPIFFPNPAGKLTIISTDDAAIFLKWVANKAFMGPINACSPDPLCLQHLVKMIEKESGKRLIHASIQKKEEESSYGVENDWCASPRKASLMGFRFTNAADWMPALIKMEKDAATIEDAKIHREGV